MSEGGLTHVVINLIYSVSSAVYLEGMLLCGNEGTEMMSSIAKFLADTLVAVQHTNQLEV
ncbi:hypothetical protein PAAG_12653 [Paracoccidioides lutzii Pb01]|uniref:Uncharacterized protein n=1 Tax=Paracoccidioides lutzii (strain ATCC MYA-826 / Pb01) TaxID=502779 RepID=A0A0A2VIH0_PARBA|nr:hypothetical protein PAAG_12653 [Paracoccidioides lutzii Pb01]KGQ00684.1 hypothetical protein PAAG_12653 [Paracoccidioides lutzii Pb01]